MNKQNTLKKPISDRLDLARKIARQAGDLTLRYFRSSELTVDRKSDDSPVTIADREAEKLLRGEIANFFPEDGIIGEEFGTQAGTSGFDWILDPIDGTKSFIHGVPIYTTLVAIIQENEPQLGVIHAPACAETIYAAVGGGCWYQDENSGEDSPVPARVSNIENLDKALMLTSELATFTTDRDIDALPAFIDLQSKVRLARTWGDAYGYLMVATGRAEIMIDPIMNLWDAAALKPIIEEAGGKFTDWKGVATVHSEESVGTNGLLTEQVLEILSSSL